MLSTALEKQISSLPLKLTIFLVFLVANANSFAQKDASDSKTDDRKERTLSEDQKLLRDLRNQLLGDRKELEKYFQKGFLEKMDKMFDDSLRRFGDDDFDDMFKAFKDGFHSGLGAGLNNQWLKEEEGMVLLIDGAMASGGSFDLKVKEGQVTIKGTLEKELGQMGKRVMSYNRSFPVPVGTDANKVRVENSEQGLKVVFPWKAGLEPSKKGDAVKKTNFGPKPKPSKLPVEKDSDDLVI